MGKKSSPKPPDPIKTAAGQTSTSVATATANQAGSMVNQIGPEGSLTYDQTDTYTYNDPVTGDTYQIPRYTATTSLSPGQQQIYDINQMTDLNLANIGQEQSSKIGSLLNDPLKLGNEATEARLFELGSKRLDPRFMESEETLRTRLANQGISQDSTAYDREMRNFYEGKNDAYNQLLLQGRGMANQEQLTERNQPINEISALLSQSQVSQPNFVSTPGYNMPTTDYAGIVNNNYTQQMQKWQADQQFGNQLMGGLFQLGSGALAASDRRLKQDIRRIGTADNGLPFYAFRYKASPDVQHFGLMADDVEKVKPEAVVTMPDGFKAVHYDMALGG